MVSVLNAGAAAAQAASEATARKPLMFQKEREKTLVYLRLRISENKENTDAMTEEILRWKRVRLLWGEGG